MVWSWKVVRSWKVVALATMLLVLGAVYAPRALAHGNVVARYAKFDVQSGSIRGLGALQVDVQHPLMTLRLTLYNRCGTCTTWNVSDGPVTFTAPSAQFVGGETAFVTLNCAKDYKITNKSWVSNADGSNAHLVATVSSIRQSTC